ncbi:uracil-DNA glycosylase [Paraburkholderia diazotrophica]|uniref:Type-4 uracil-DNA glycosylase n=1 Tax=Paraburkholderia diazotrophica TaxID=667676 RepID=A0A1H6URZ2_9BURK|nr:uracil-DNA glycosylase [Paraburkholderia diazotrophica]SEI95193.1 DNA polymerase [Paraburkholderia diazotrophica]
MALHESALEELGLAPIWMRRGIAQHAAAADDPQLQAESADAATRSAASTDADAPGEDVAVRVAALSAGNGDGNGNEVSRAAASPEASQPQDEPQTEPEGAPASRREPTPDEAHRAMPQPARRASARDMEAAPPDDDFAWFDDLPAEPPSHTEAQVARPAQPAVDTLDWNALEERVSACERCRLCEKRTNTVFGVGDREADWMLIGEAPGENEDKQGEPFVGQAGKLLDNMLRSLGLARDMNVYIANVIKCRPPGNRNPEPDEVARCEPYLQRQVALVKPKLIVALGRFAAQSLLKTDASISSLRGRVHEYEGVPVVVTYHPAYLLRSLGDKAKSWQDLCLARDAWRNASPQDTQADASK